MQQFYDPPQVSSRRDLAHLFQTISRDVSSKAISDQFVPFAQERDKLGRLISRENKYRRRTGSQSLPSQMLIKRNSNPEILSQKGKISDQVVERVFKLHELKEMKSSKDLNKMRILSTSSRDKTNTPVVGQYDVAALADKFKYKKFNIIAINNPKTTPPLPRQQSIELIPKRIKPPPVHQEPHHVTKLKETPKVMNFDLPQLEKYHQMKKLKMKHYQNFEQSHSKFKQLARHSLVLANQIKKGLQLD